MTVVMSPTTDPADDRISDLASFESDGLDAGALLFMARGYAKENSIDLWEHSE
jgi:hypothetical protein